jgi:hypothetical protein
MNEDASRQSVGTVGIVVAARLGGEKPCTVALRPARTLAKISTQCIKEAHGVDAAVDVFQALSALSLLSYFQLEVESMFMRSRDLSGSWLERRSAQ